MPLKLCLLAIFCAVLPDADVLSFKFGIPYGSLWGHRGITHSIFFSVLLGVSVVSAFYRKLPRFGRQWWMLAAFFAAVTLSHTVLDAMTTGGKGVAFFAPFDNGRYFLPFRPIQVSPIGVGRFFSHRGWQVLRSELLWIGLPAAAVFVASWIAGKIRKV